MTNFLPAGVINDTILEVQAKCCDLQQCLAQQKLYDVKQGLKEIEEMVVALAVFLEKLSCQPLIYTGTGTTEEIIRRLEWALAFSEGIDPVEYDRYIKEIRKTAK